MEAFTATGRFTTTVGTPRYIEVDTAISPACTYIYIGQQADRAVDMLLTADETTKLIAALTQTLPGGSIDQPGSADPAIPHSAIAYCDSCN